MEFENQRMLHLLELAQMLAEQNDFHEMLRVTAKHAASLMHAESATIMMLNPQTHHTVKTVASEGREPEDQAQRLARVHVSGWVIKHAQPFLSFDLRQDARFAANLFAHTTLHTVLAAPLRSSGVVFGALVLLNVTLPPTPQIAPLDFLQKLAALVAPFLHDAQKLQQFFEAPLPQATLLAKYEAVGLLGMSPKFIEALQALEAAARCDVRVLLEGQSGTGKELFAKAIHHFSRRAAGPFLALDCGAIAEYLIESELFGHVKGAFTGATHDRRGMLAEANHGTLFMDEIASLPLEMQAKFMRVLQAGEIRPVGSNKTVAVDVRIIAASSRPLRKLVEAHTFREDLFYRLHVYPIHVPALAERSEDIPLLARHFLKKFVAQQEKQAHDFHEEILAFMLHRTWPGNVRELENFVERLVTLVPAQARQIARESLPHELKREMERLAASPAAPGAIASLHELLSEYEAQSLRKTLQAHAWNQSQTARALKVSEQTLRYKMGKLGIAKMMA